MLYCWGRLTDTTQDIMCKYSILLPSCRTNLIPIFCSSMDQRQEIVISWRRWLIPHQWIPVTCWCVCIIKACTNEHLELGVTPIFQQSNVRDYFSYRNIVISSLPFISLLFSLPFLSPPFPPSSSLSHSATWLPSFLMSPSSQWWSDCISWCHPWAEHAHTTPLLPWWPNLCWGPHLLHCHQDVSGRL